MFQGNGPVPKTFHEEFVLIAGTGHLPNLILEAALSAGATATVLVLPGRNPDDFPDHRCLQINLGNYREVFCQLAQDGLQQAVLAGGVDRPSIPSEGIPEIWAGDDSAIRSLLAPIETLGFEIAGVQDVVPELLASAGVVSRATPNKVDMGDAARAAGIVSALGRVDVGQAVVVVHGICVAVESATGTDCMLATVGPAIERLFPHNSERVGLLYKAAKPGQDMRVDVPVVGPETVRRVARAGLRGIAVQSGGVMLLQRAEMIDLADMHGLFIWGIREEFD